MYIKLNCENTNYYDNRKQNTRFVPKVSGLGFILVLQHTWGPIYLILFQVTFLSAYTFLCTLCPIRNKISFRMLINSDAEWNMKIYSNYCLSKTEKKS